MRTADAIAVARALGNAATQTLLNQYEAITIERRALLRLHAVEAGELLGESLATRLEALRVRGEELDKLAIASPDSNADTEQELMDYLNDVAEKGEVAALHARLSRQSSNR